MRTEAIEIINYRGHDIEVFLDEDAPSPDEWGDDDAFIVYDHRDFCVKRDGFDPRDIYESMQNKYKQRKLYDGYWVFTLYAYIHSGVALSLGRNTYPFTDGWDVSTTGFVLVRRDKGTWSENKAYKVAQSIVDEWNMFLSGDVYGYNSNAGSCWGFYGNEGKKQMIAEAKSEIDSHIHKLRHKHFNQLKIWIKNRVPLEYRKSFQLN